MNIVISICIPVYNSELFFPRALDSIKNQQLSECGLKQSQLELVIINDCSTGTDSLGRDCTKIIKSFKKQTSCKINYIIHKQQTPLLETRRELVEQAHGKYIMMVDSDDYLSENCISVLYKLIVSTGADIVQGDNTEFIEKAGKIKFLEKNRTGLVFNGTLEGSDVLASWLVHKKTSAFLWAKIITRELYLDAFDKLIFSDCNIVDDVPLYFFIAYFSKKYAGTNQIVYNYRTNSGITSNPAITDLSKWKRSCTMVSGYSIVVNWINSQINETGESPVAEAVNLGFQENMVSHLETSVIQLHKYINPVIYDEARRMLCDSWGQSFVEKIEEKLGFSTKQ